MISIDDKGKLDRIEQLRLKADFGYVYLPFMIFFSITFVSIYWFLTGRAWKNEYYFFIFLALLGLVSFISRIKEQRKAKEEIKQLKGELGL